MNSLKNIGNRFLDSCKSLKLSFWIREYVLAIAICFMFCYIPRTFPPLIFIVNVLLFPLSKIVWLQVMEWVYRYGFQVDPDTVIHSINIITLFFKLFKNVALFLYSCILGWFGILLLLVYSFKKQNI